MVSVYISALEGKVAIEEKRLMYIFPILVFMYVILVGLFVQTILLPYLIPSAHYGEGILNGTDTIYFHEESKKLAKEISLYGWSRWSLKPEGQIMIGITSLIYVLTGIYKPYVMLFYNALLHSLSALFLMKLLTNYGISIKYAIFGSLPLVFFPSNLMWISQIHRDGLYILGFLAFFLSISYIHKKGYKILLYFLFLQAFGLFLIYLAREHMVLPFKYVFSFLFVVSLLFLALKFIGLFKENLLVERQVLSRFTVLAFAVVIVSSILAPQTQTQTQTQTQIKWEKEIFVPEKIDKILYNIAVWRYMFLNVYFKDAKGNIEQDFIPQKASDFLLYLPRGLYVGLFYPTPEFWFKEGGTTGGNIARTIIPFETVVVWIGIIGFVFAFYNLPNRFSILIILLLCLMFIYLHVITEPNLGPIVRKRYVFISMLIGFSYSYLIWRLSLWLKRA